MAVDVSAFAAVQHSLDVEHARLRVATCLLRWSVSVHGGGCGLAFVVSGSRSDAFTVGTARFREAFRTAVDPTVEVVRVVEGVAGAVAS